MRDSDYTWKIVKSLGKEVLSIIDLDKGRVSVTNNIENIVEQIERMLTAQGKSLPEFIVYRDSDQTWDGWDNKRQDFILLSAYNESVAIERLIRVNEKKIDADRS